MKAKQLFFYIMTLLVFASCHKDDDLTSIIEATSAQFYKSSFSLAVGGREKIMLTLEPEGSELSDAQWSSSDTTIAAIDEQGIVTAISAGNATISVTAKNKISGKCSVEVIESPVTDLVMPDANYPVAKDALVIIQCKGFTSDCKILLRPHTDFKSTNDGDLLATIVEQNEIYLSFFCSFSIGWYDVILEKEAIEYNLGNIEVETPNIPEYSYDKNKLFWDDNHWRRFQLRGKVKEITVKIESYNTFLCTSKTTGSTIYGFNDKGYIISQSQVLFLNNNIKVADETSSIRYDDQNRPAEMSDQNMDGDIDKTNFTYGDHNFYYPIRLWFFGDFGRVNDDDNTIWVKGLVEMKNSFTDGTKTIDKTTIKVNSNSLVADDSVKYLNGDYFFSNCNYTYNGMFPVSMLKKSKLMTSYGYSNYIYRSNYKFDEQGLPINIKEQGTLGDYRTYTTEFIQKTPFYLYSKKGYSTYEYDENWNLVQEIYTNQNVKNCSVYYISYDDFGNWTQCKCVDNINYQIKTITREITYW